MTYLVTWTTAALAQLAAIVALHGDRRAVDQAAQWVDYTLRRIPYEVGESRQSADVRLWYGDVLGVYYHVNPAALTVRVASVAPARRPRA
ncbi:MAG: hypothetical protein K2X87_07225 [Gemmataceae bacterium]|nr:hypothetical protein [Gemmataceae bacterium]